MSPWDNFYTNTARKDNVHGIVLKMHAMPLQLQESAKLLGLLPAPLTTAQDIL